jgi:hypothetical protein
MGGQHKMGSTYKEPLPPPTIMPTSGIWAYGGQDGSVNVLIAFASTMSSHVPSPDHLTIKSDGVPMITRDMSGWDDNQHLTVIADYLPAPPTVVTFSYDGLDPLFQSASGLRVAAFADLALIAT